MAYKQPMLHTHQRQRVLSRLEGLELCKHHLRHHCTAVVKVTCVTVQGSIGNAEKKGTGGHTESWYVRMRVPVVCVVCHGEPMDRIKRHAPATISSLVNEGHQGLHVIELGSEADVQ